MGVRTPLKLDSENMVKESRNIRRHVLPNGLTVITEQMSHIRSVSIGIWLKSGSRDEDSEWNGISHFIEHMVFKGTESRSAEAIARQVDSIGGNMDAFTAKECICFNIKVLDEHLPVAMDVLSDLVLHPVFDANDIARERGVILEEIKMDQDNPDYLVHEIFTQSFWKDHALGRPILGTRETVKKFERSVISRFYGHHFAPANLIVSAAGNLNHDRFVALVARHFEHVKPRKNGLHSPPPKTFARINLRNKKSLEQVQICIGVPSHPIAHENRHASYILNALLGGGMSSRLFQNVRERLGLAYSIYSDLNPYRDTGSMCIYAGTSRESAVKVIECVVAEFCNLKSSLVPEEELRRSKDQLKGSLMLSLESSTARMSNLARQEMYFDRFYSLDELIERIEAVTAEDLQQSANTFFTTDQIAVTILGNLTGLKLRREQLAC
jgi:predicted Zn-dependent peptidase